MTSTDDHELERWDESDRAEFRWTDGLPPAASSGRWRWIIPWSLLAAIAFLAFELSGNLFLAGFVFCLKFAIRDVMTALWLVRTDPIQSRGWTCGLLTGAWGLLKAAFAGHLGVPIIAAVTFLIEFRVPNRMNQMQELSAVGIAFALADIVGIGLCTVLTWSAAGIALRTGRRVWIDSTVSWSHRRQAWPPNPFGKNRAEWLIWFAAFSPTILSVSGSIWLIVAVWGLPGDPALMIGVPVGALVMATLMVTMALTRLEPVIASDPSECWPEVPACDLGRPGR